MNEVAFIFMSKMPKIRKQHGLERQTGSLAGLAGFIGKRALRGLGCISMTNITWLHFIILS